MDFHFNDWIGLSRSTWNSMTDRPGMIICWSAYIFPLTSLPKHLQAGFLLLLTRLCRMSHSVVVSPFIGSVVLEATPKTQEKDQDGRKSSAVVIPPLPRPNAILKKWQHNWQQMDVKFQLSIGDFPMICQKLNSITNIFFSIEIARGRGVQFSIILFKIFFSV